MPRPRVHGHQLACSFGNLAHSPRELLLCVRLDRLLPKRSLKGIRVVAPMAVEQPQSGITQKPSKPFAFRRDLRSRQSSPAVVIKVIFQNCEFLFVMMARLERTKSFRDQDIIVAGRAELLGQPHKLDLQFAEV